MAEPRRARCAQLTAVAYFDPVTSRVVDKLYMVSTQNLAYERYADGNLERFKPIEMPEEPLIRARPAPQLRQVRSTRRSRRK